MPLKAAYCKILAGIVLPGALLFGLRGDFDWPQAWIYMLLHAMWSLGTVPWLEKYNPGLLQKRLFAVLKAKALWEKIFIETNLLLYVLMMAVSAMDAAQRTAVPLYIVIAAFAGAVSAYALILYALKANKYAVKTVEVVEGQQVVSSGPYAAVRHPMYAGVCLLYVSTPPALGSWRGLIPAALIILSVMFRIHLEEKTLKQELPGYGDYMRKVKFRLIPGIW